jgi:hypothetical protein
VARARGGEVKDGGTAPPQHAQLRASQSDSKRRPRRRPTGSGRPARQARWGASGPVRPGEGEGPDLPGRPRSRGGRGCRRGTFGPCARGQPSCRGRSRCRGPASCGFRAGGRASAWRTASDRSDTRQGKVWCVSVCRTDRMWRAGQLAVNSHRMFLDTFEAFVHQHCPEGCRDELAVQ